MNAGRFVADGITVSDVTHKADCPGQPQRPKQPSYYSAEPVAAVGTTALQQRPRLPRPLVIDDAQNSTTARQLRSVIANPGPPTMNHRRYARPSAAGPVNLTEKIPTHRARDAFRHETANTHRLNHSAPLTTR